MANKNPVPLAAAVVLTALALTAFVVLQGASHRKQVAADRAATRTYALSGLPCPPLTAEAFATLRQGRQGLHSGVTNQADANGVSSVS